VDNQEKQTKQKVPRWPASLCTLVILGLNIDAWVQYHETKVALLTPLVIIILGIFGQHIDSNANPIIKSPEETARRMVNNWLKTPNENQYTQELQEFTDDIKNK
jgi:hypothetical protein